MLDWFSAVPGLLTPEMEANTRRRALLGAAASLMKASGPRERPVGLFEALGEGLSGALDGQEAGTTNALRQALIAEQVRKASDERAQRQRWEQIFGITFQQPGASSSVPTGPGVSSVPSVPAAPAMPRASAPVDTTGMPPDAANVANPPQGGTAAPKPLVRSTGAGGLPDVMREMPPAVRTVIGLSGPTKGVQTLTDWVTRKPGSFLTVEFPDGTRKAMREDSTDIQNAINSGAIVVTTPSSKKDTDVINVKGVDGIVRGYRKNDPAIDSVIAAGGMVVGHGKAEDDKPSDKFISVEMGDGSLQSHRADSKELDAAIRSGGRVVDTPPAALTREAKTFLLPNGDNVLSHDGGRTYRRRDGTRAQIPTDAIPLGPETASDAARKAKVISRAEGELEKTPAMADRPPAEGPANAGTGPWASLQAAADATAGGIGVDKVFGKAGLFPQTGANRQYLLNLRQTAKTALVNNPRFPVAEQKNVDRLFPDPDSMWRNPAIEAQKVPLLRNMLKEQLAANNEAIASGALSEKEMGDLTRNNIETRRALRLLGDGDASLDALKPKGPKTQDRVPDLPTTAPRPGRRTSSGVTWSIE